MHAGTLLTATLALGLPAVAAIPPARAQQPSVLSTGITGRLTASGLASPTYALSFPAVQRLILDAVRTPVTPSHADSVLRPTPVRLADLVRLGLLREVDGRFEVSYLVLTVDDQRSIYRLAQRYGADLARAIDGRRDQFRRFLDWYPEAELRETLLFDLVAGMLLNWDGLRLTSELGLRAKPIRRANGDEFLVHSKERGANLDLTGLYWGSESWPGKQMTLTTFGDANSFPRSRGLPNILDAVFEDGLASIQREPELFGAARGQLLTYLGISLDDAGAVLAVLADGPATRESIAERLVLPEERLAATLTLLEAINYICAADTRYHINIPVLTAKDRAIVDSSLHTGRAILSDWLAANGPAMERELAGLSPLRNGLPYSLIFSEVWHYVFGFATKSLAESGFFLNPRAAGRVAAGYVPFAWASVLYPL